MTIRSSIQLFELNRVNTSVHIGLLSEPSSACIGLIIGFVAFICDILPVTAVRWRQRGFREGCKIALR
jgi:hypothetical protein